MTNRTKSVILGCTAMMVGGFTHSMLQLTPLAASPLLKAGAVGMAAIVALFVLNALLPSKKAA